MMKGKRYLTKPHDESNHHLQQPDGLYIFNERVMKKEKKTTEIKLSENKLIVDCLKVKPETLEDFKERVKEPGSDGNYIRQCKDGNPDGVCGEELDKEIVICAAVQLHDGRIFRGHRHADCFAVMRGINPKIEWPNDNEQGFITSKNRFVTRQEGRKLQDAAGIPSASKDGYQGNTLFSEDLY